MTITTGTSGAIVSSIQFTPPPFPPADLAQIRRSWESDCEIFAFDIETDTSGTPFKYPNGTESLHPAGLDPRVSKVITIAVAGSKGSSFVLDSTSNEAMLLEALEAIASRVKRNHHFSTSLFLGWNSTFFDIPFLDVRSRMIGANLSTRLRMDHSTSYVPKYGYPEWLSEVRMNEWNKAFLGEQNVIDIVPLFKPIAAERGISCSLKPVAEALGFNPVQVDASKMHELTSAERSEYCLSDAKTTLDLALWLVENAD